MPIAQRRTKHRLRTIWRLPDDLWAELEPLLPPEKPPGTPGRPAVPFRHVIDGILYVLRTGCQWKALPREYGSGSTCHRRFPAPGPVRSGEGRGGEEGGRWGGPAP